MCIAVFIWKAHPLYPFLLFLNRDEYHNRPTKPLSWWEDTDILGGRDEVAGGTWLACTRTGRLAFLTNVREINSNSHTKSRGDLPLRFLKSVKSPRDFSEQLLIEAGEYNGFNLIVADLCSMTMLYITNRPKHTGMSVTEVSPGIHVLSNASLDSPWPKSQRLECSFKQLLDEYGESEIPIGQAAERIMRDVAKEDSNLPGIYSPECEYQLSSIFVDTEMSMGRFCTRSTSSLAVRSSGDATFYEVYLEKDIWKEQQITFVIEKMIDGVVSTS
nr:transport and Golgi organization 2 homolog [Solanum lycopersicum]